MKRARVPDVVLWPAAYVVDGEETSSGGAQIGGGVGEEKGCP